MKEFVYDGEKYQIDDSKIVPTGGDLDESNKIAFVDKGIPEKFHEGIAVHEIEERKLLMKGHSYVYSHNEAQKKELEFYEKVYGKEKALGVLEEEEEIVLTTCNRRIAPRKTKIFTQEAEVTPPPPRPIIEIKTINEIVFEDKRYIIDNSEKLIGTLADIYERGDIIYIDRDVPERFFEGVALGELVARRCIKKGMSLDQALGEANKTEQEYLITKHGTEQGKELYDDEFNFLSWKYSTEKKELKAKNGSHKVIYDKDEILPR